MREWWPFRSRARSPRQDRSSGGGERICLAAEPRPEQPRYSIAAADVLPSGYALGREDYRRLVADGMLAVIEQLGPKRLGTIIGADSQTVRDARDEITSLGGHLACNLLLADRHALDPLFAHFGKALVDIDPTPVTWAELGAAAAELSAEICRIMADKGRVANGDVPKLKRLARAVSTAAQAAVIKS